MNRQQPPGAHSRTGEIYSFMDMVAMDAEIYAADHTTPMSPILEEVQSFTLTQTAHPSMLTGRVEGRFLQLVAQLSNARNIVDIGTFTGFSALAMSEAIPRDGMIQTIENNLDHARIAQAFFDRSPYGFKIQLRLGNALEILQTLPDRQTDLVFIDADKQNYSAYYLEAMRILRDGGLILADNVLWYGRIFEPKDDESRAVAAFNDLVNNDGRAENIFLTLRDGIYVIRKLPC
ncbi:MAG TPA: class I SAM-dependent methyltransferase [Dissulfurispiraceae bacterium]|nr:class I SAM-dependent methyltransferase [Dissulfurispiraceae bacterium]